jgi:hypothetical protein
VATVASAVCGERGNAAAYVYTDGIWLAVTYTDADVNDQIDDGTGDRRQPATQKNTTGTRLVSDIYTYKR